MPVKGTLHSPPGNPHWLPIPGSGKNSALLCIGTLAGERNAAIQDHSGGERAPRYLTPVDRSRTFGGEDLSGITTELIDPQENRTNCAE